MAGRPESAPEEGTATVPELIATLRSEGPRLARAATAAGLDAAVPDCPGWQVRDLMRHLGGVQRWATVNLAERRQEPMTKADEEALMSSWPPDPELPGWLLEGHRRLVEALLAAPGDLQCWTFLPAPSPLTFWARRQAHEVEVHRVDAEAAAGWAVEVQGPSARDGIAEILLGFAARPRRLELELPTTLRLSPTDSPIRWLVTLGPDGVRARPEDGPADCEVRGSSSDLYLLLWNRGSREHLEVTGDREPLELWRRTVRVRW